MAKASRALRVRAVRRVGGPCPASRLRAVVARLRAMRGEAEAISARADRLLARLGVS